MADPSPSAKAVTVGSSPASQQTGTEAKETLKVGSVYPAMVAHVDPVSRTMDVVLDDDKTICNCYYMASDVAGVLGFGSASLPAKGSRVLLVYGSPAYVLGGGAQYVGDPKDFTAPATGELGNDFTNYKPFGIQHDPKKTFRAPGYNAAQDVMPGEFELTNHMGVFVRLLHNFAQLSAGDIAKVECHLMNDMVRIVDNYYAHHSCGGDTLIWNNGRNTIEDHFTGYPHEAEGKLHENDELVGEKGDYVYAASKFSNNDTGRWRKSEFVGYLGDIIHTWITDPTTAKTSYGKESKRAGKCRVWNGSDGTFMVASMTAIHLEVNPEIVIPYFTAKWDDPEADTSSVMSQISPQNLKLWGTGADNWKDVRVACWQMRSYAKYFTLYHSLARWLDLAKAGNWVKVPTEQSNTPGEATNKERDVEKMNPGSQCPYLGRASITIDGSGSVTILSNGEKGNGVSSVILNEGNIQIAAANNLELQCGGCFSVAAKNISMKAVNNVEIAAITGGLWLKARMAWNALCEKGTVWLRSYRKKGVSAAPTPLVADVDDIPVLPHEESMYGVKIESTSAPVLVHGATGILEKTSEPEAEIKLHTVGDGSPVTIVSTSSITGYSTGPFCITGPAGGGSSFLVDKKNSVFMGAVGFGPAQTAVIHDGGMYCKAGFYTEGSIGANGMVGTLGAGHLAKLLEPVEVEGSDPKDLYDQLSVVAATATQDASRSENNHSWVYPNMRTTYKGYEWTDLKLAPYADAFIAGGKAKDAMENLVEVNWKNTGPLDKDWNPITSSGMWPGLPSVAKVGTFLKQNAPALGKDPWSKWYTKDDIGGMKFLDVRPYFWMVQKRETK